MVFASKTFFKKNFSDESCPLPPSMLHLAPTETLRHLAGSQNPMCRWQWSMIMLIRVGMAMMEVVVTDLKHFSNISEWQISQSSNQAATWHPACRWSLTCKLCSTWKEETMPHYALPIWLVTSPWRSLLAGQPQGATSRRAEVFQTEPWLKIWRYIGVMWKCGNMRTRI